MALDPHIENLPHAEAVVLSQAFKSLDRVVAPDAIATRAFLAHLAGACEQQALRTLTDVLVAPIHSVEPDVVVVPRSSPRRRVRSR